MSEWSWLAKMGSDASIATVLLAGMVMLYRLLDKYGAAFLAEAKGQVQSMTEQAASVTALAASVREGQTEQREVLMAVRVQARVLEEIREFMAELSRERSGR